jgi:pyrrolidone-carboxylate peptidase
MTRIRALVLVAGLAGCTAPGPMPAAPAGGNADDGILRDLRNDGKTDESGHAVNAIVVEAETFCHGAGGVVEGGYRSDTAEGVVCDGTFPTLPTEDLIVNLRLRASGYDVTSTSDVVAAMIRTDNGSTTRSLTGRSFRGEGEWTFLPIELTHDGGDVHLTIATYGRGVVEIDYAEAFINRFPVALGPGSGVLADNDIVTVESPLHDAAPVLVVNGRDVKLDDLLTAGTATRYDTTYRSVFSIAVGTLAAGDASDLDLFARAATDVTPTARMRVYRSALPCLYEGDANGRKVLVTGFQPFPVDEGHDNVSGVAVTALDPSTLNGAKVMRLVLPVEYDGSPAIVASAIARCSPDVVISFGQGDGGIDLEHTAYNLKDTAELTDNRGRFQAGVPIDPTAPTSRPSTLPLDRIKDALMMMPQGPLGALSINDSDDPGRYVCNDTFFGNVSAQGPSRAGFIHLPYTTDFNERTRPAWGQLVAAAVQAAVSN